MNQKAYVILSTYGEYDDFNSIPLFVCTSIIERDLFFEALQNHESPYYDKVIECFHKMYPCSEIENCIPEDIGFDWKEVELLSLI